jgi:hypothetical protein
VLCIAWSRGRAGAGDAARRRGAGKLARAARFDVVGDDDVRVSVDDVDVSLQFATKRSVSRVARHALPPVRTALLRAA